MAVVKFTSRDEDVARTIDRLERKVIDLEGKLSLAGKAGQRVGRELKRTGTDGEKAFDSITRGARELIGALGVGAGVAGAVASVNRGYETWLQNMREISAEAGKAAREFVAFAALQEGGAKAGRVRRAAGLATRFGVTDRGLAFDLVQALQSAIAAKEPQLTEEQAFGKAMGGAGAVFAAAQLGVPLEAGRQLAALAPGQGMTPEHSLRMAYVAGQASVRSPAVLSKAGPALTFFDDKRMGYAMGAVLSGGVAEDQLQTYLKNAGIGLSATSADEFQATLQKLGVAGGTRYEKLAALRAAGITTTEQVGLAGLKEQRAQFAVSYLLQNFADIMPAYERIGREATPGLFARQRTAVEQELPAAKVARDIDILKSEVSNLAAFGPRAMPALGQERRRRLLAASFRRRGLEEGMFGMDYIGPEGEMTDYALFRAALDQMNPISAMASGDPARSRRFAGALREYAMRAAQLEGGQPAGQLNWFMNLMAQWPDIGGTAAAAPADWPQKLEAMLGKVEQAGNALDRAAGRLERAAGGGAAMTPIMGEPK